MNKQLVVLTTSDLENMHKIQLNMLIEFDKICRRNNIKYILDAGTLLGAVPPLQMVKSQDVVQFPFQNIP